MKLKQVFVLFWAVLGTYFAQAQSNPKFSGKDANTNEADFQVFVSKSKDFCVGDEITLTFRGNIRVDGWHLYSARTDGNISYNPTMLEIFGDESKGIKAKGGMTENKKAHEEVDELLGGLVRSFEEKQVDFSQRVVVTGKDVVLIGELSAQTCTSEGMCKFLKLPFEWKFTANDCGTGAVEPVIETPAGENPCKSEWGFAAYDSSKTLNENIGRQEIAMPGLLAKGSLNQFSLPCQAFAYAKEVGRPALLFFSKKANCPECEAFEAKVMGDAEVKDILAKRLVLARFNVDETAALPDGFILKNGKKTKTLGEYFEEWASSDFGTVLRPTLVVTNEEGKSLGTVAPDADPVTAAQMLEAGLKAYYAAKGRNEAPFEPVVKTETANAVSTTEPSKSPEEEDGGLFWTFLKAMGGGFLALLTPCVFPMIPMTVSFFVKQGEGEENAKKGLRNAVTYALSIVFIYGIAGFLISIFLPPDTLYNLGSDAVPNMIFFLIFFAFALSFFGLFEITLPSSWSTAMNNKAGAGGMLGPFFMALTLVIVSFSCTGPILGTAIVQSSQGAISKWTPFMSFLGFGVAFAIPFGLLAVFPKLMGKLPDAGGWMNTVKVVFGFLELALCLKFLSNVDLVMHWHILDRTFFLGIWIVIFALLGAYFLGWITLPHDDKVERVSVPRLLFAVMSFSFVMYLFPGLWGSPLSALEGLIPPTTKNVGVKLLPHQVEVHGGGSGEKTLNQEICASDRKYSEIAADRESHGLCMFYDLEQAVEFAKAKNKPLFVDFTGHSCANCRKMEQGVWTDERIMTLLTQEFVTVSLYADEKRTNFDPPKMNAEGKPYRSIGHWVTDYQSKNYGLISQPYYVLMDYDFSSLNVPVGFTPDINSYHAFLEAGLAEFEKRHGSAAE